MGTVLETGSWCLASILALQAAYLSALTVGSWLYRVPTARGRRVTRFAILVPAHNESSGILPTLRDLMACAYPEDLRDVHVIADNCTDDTAAMARSGGACVYERKDATMRGKGHALDWFLSGNKELLSGYDAIVIIDADMKVSREFLSALDDAFTNEQHLVVQGKYLASNPSESWISAFGFLGFAVANHVRPAGRCFIGSSAGLKGSGMAFRRDLLLTMGWPCKSVAEDLEFGKELALRGVRILYVPDAAVSSDLGVSARQAYVQQERWEGGRASVTLKYLRLLFGRLVQRPSWHIAEEILDLLVPPLSVLAALTILGIVVSWAANGTALWLVLSCSGVFLALVVTGMVQARMPLRAVGYLAGLPVFLAMKLILLAKTALLGSNVWRRTPRSK